VRFAGGERIFSEADIGTTMYIVQSGKVRLFRIVDGAERAHGTMEKGDFFGEMSILEGRPRTGHFPTRRKSGRAHTGVRTGRGTD